MLRIVSMPLDMTKVKGIIYHLPEGETFTMNVDGVDEIVDFSYGRICDTSDIDGYIHFYPEGNA